ncbi:MAG: nitrilase family protein [Bacteroidales bacterium]|nr:nitrilase family protein [Bacteroidales bacterium]
MQPTQNRQHIEQMLTNMPTSDIVLLPETFTTGFGDNMAQCAECPESDTLQWARTIAKQHDTLVVGTWIVNDNGRCYNRMHWVMPSGEYGYYDKAHLFRISSEARQLSAGTKQTTFEWRGWRIRPSVCYDLRFPTWLHNRVDTNGELEYDLLLFSANWPEARRGAWSTLLRARAIENLCYVAGCNRVGVDASEVVYGGNSAIIDFKGQTIVESTNEEIITAELDSEKLQRFRTKCPFHLDYD